MTLFRLITISDMIMYDRVSLKAYIHCLPFTLQSIGTDQHSDEIPTDCYTLSRTTSVESLMHWATGYPCSKSRTPLSLTRSC